MRNPFGKPFLAAAAVAFFASCILVSNPEGDDPGWRTVPERTSKPSSSRTEFRQTVDLAPGGTLSLENDYGDVAITGWDRSTVEVVARTPAVEEDRRYSARQGRSSQTVPEVEIREGRGGLLIRTPTFEGPGRPPAVSFEVRVPNSIDLTGIRISEGDLKIADVFGRLEVSVDAGNLSVRNFSGSVGATVGTGSADVEVLDLREGDEISISARRGDVALRLESGAGAIVEADAPRGEVTSDFDLGQTLPASTVKGWIGQGGPTIILRASEGRIRIIKVAGTPEAARGAGEK